MPCPRPDASMWLFRVTLVAAVVTVLRDVAADPEYQDTEDDDGDDADFDDLYAAEDIIAATAVTALDEIGARSRVRRDEEQSPEVRTLSVDEIREVKGALKELLAGRQLDLMTTTYTTETGDNEATTDDADLVTKHPAFTGLTKTDYVDPTKFYEDIIEEIIDNAKSLGLLIPTRRASTDVDDESNVIQVEGETVKTTPRPTLTARLGRTEENPQRTIDMATPQGLLAYIKSSRTTGESKRERTPGVSKPGRTPRASKPGRTPGVAKPGRTPGASIPGRTPGAIKDLLAGRQLDLMTITETGDNEATTSRRRNVNPESPLSDRPPMDYPDYGGGDSKGGSGYEYLTLPEYTISSSTTLPPLSDPPPTDYPEYGGGDSKGGSVDEFLTTPEYTLSSSTTLPPLSDPPPTDYPEPGGGDSKGGSGDEFLTTPAYTLPSSTTFPPLSDPPPTDYPEPGGVNSKGGGGDNGEKTTIVTPSTRRRTWRRRTTTTPTTTTSTRRRTRRRRTTTTPTTTTVITTTQTTTTTIAEPEFDIPALVDLIANLTYDFESNITLLFNKTLQKYNIPTCKSPEPITTESIDDDLANATVVAKCFVCGMHVEGIPKNAHCSDAFAGDFLPLMPVDRRAKGKLALFRKYCRYLDVNGFYETATEPRSVYGRFTGGCSVRWVDLSGVYTQRACRNTRRAMTGRHFGSKRMAKLEMALKDVDNGCIISPMSSLVPLSRGISLYARFHACVCTGSWCNITSSTEPWIACIALLTLWTAAVATLQTSIAREMNVVPL